MSWCKYFVEAQDYGMNYEVFRRDKPRLLIYFGSNFPEETLRRSPVRNSEQSEVVFTNLAMVTPPNLLISFQ